SVHPGTHGNAALEQHAIGRPGLAWCSGQETPSMCSDSDAERFHATERPWLDRVDVIDTPPQIRNRKLAVDTLPDIGARGMIGFVEAVLHQLPSPLGKKPDGLVILI